MSCHSIYLLKVVLNTIATPFPHSFKQFIYPLLSLSKFTTVLRFLGGDFCLKFLICSLQYKIFKALEWDSVFNYNDVILFPPVFQNEDTVKPV